MSLVYGERVNIWIEKNKPHDGVFRAYWTEDGEGISSEDTGFGLRFEWNYKDGKPDGISKGWWPNGQLKQTRPWKNGILDGIWTFWHRNGEKQSEGPFKKGFAAGEWTYWNPDGTVKEKKILGPKSIPRLK